MFRNTRNERMVNYLFDLFLLRVFFFLSLSLSFFIIVYTSQIMEDRVEWKWLEKIKFSLCSRFMSKRFFFFTDFHGYSLRVDGRKQHGRVLRSSSEDHQLRVSRIFVEKKR